MGGVLYSKDLSTLVLAPAGVGDAVTIAPEATEIGERAFSACADLKSIVVPGCVEAIAASAFSDEAKANATVALASGDDYDARKAVWEAAGFSRFAEPARPGDVAEPKAEESGFAFKMLDDFTLAVSWTGEADPAAELAIPSTGEVDGATYPVSAVAREGFAGRASIESVSIPAGVSVIGDGTFDGCANLAQAELPDGLEYVGSRAFAGTALRSVTLPASVRTVAGGGAFSDCSALERVLTFSNSIDVAADALSGCSNVAIYAPYDKDGAYPWNVGLVAAGNHVLPYGLTLASEPLSLEVGQSVDLFEGGVQEVPAGCELSYSYAATPISVDAGQVTGKKAGTSEVTAVLTLDGQELARATRTVEVRKTSENQLSSGNGSSLQREIPILSLNTALAPSGETEVNPMATQYKVTFQLDNGYNSTANAFAGDPFPYPGQTWAPSGQTIVGWRGSGSIWYPGVSTMPGYSFTVTPVYDTECYCVHFDANDGQGEMGDQYIPSGETANLLANKFTRTGYEFSGWSTSPFQNTATYSDGASVSNLAGSGGGTTLFAVWTPLTYTLSFISNGGTNPDNVPRTYTIEESVTLPKPTRTGYTFVGWFTSSNLTGTAVASIPVGSTGNKTFYAKWTPTYTITYNLDGGTNPSGAPLQYTTEAAVTLPRPTKTGYSFGGWFTSSNLSGSAVTSISKGETGNKIFYAKWNPYRYTIHFVGGDADDGVMTDLPMTYGAAKSLPACGFSLYGHAFNGWTTNANGTGASYSDRASVNNLTTVNGGVVNLYAQWRESKYTIAYNGNGDDETHRPPASHECTYGSDVTIAGNTFTRPGYTFAGWSTNSSGQSTVYSSGTTSWGDGSLPDGSTYTLYAQWTLADYSINYNLDGGTNPSDAPKKYTYETAVTLPTPTKAGYEFAGWFTSSSLTGTAATSIPKGSFDDKYYYAKWTPNRYEIIFSAPGSLVIPSGIEVTYGTPWTVPDDILTRPGYTFLGWSKSSSATTASYLPGRTYSEHLTTGTDTPMLYAVWLPNTNTSYLVRHWIQKLGAGSEQNSTNYEVYVTDSPKGTTDTKVTPPRKTISGFTAPSGKEVTISGDGRTIVDYYYTRNSYKLTVVSVVGVDTTGSSPNDFYQFGATITLKAKAKTGYTLGKWTSSTKLATAPSGAEGTFTMPIINVIMTPSATPNTYTVTYEANGGTGTAPASQTCTYDVNFMTKANTFTREDYTFTGWNTQRNGSGKSYGANTSQKNLAASGSVTLYAQWEKTVFTVHFDANGGTGTMPDQKFNKGEEKILTPNAFTRPGYEFTNMWSDVSYTEGSLFPANQKLSFNEDITLYALWSIITYNITFNTNGGSNPPGVPASYTVEDAKTLPTPSKTGYNFAGWYENSNLTGTAATQIAKGSTGNKIYYAKWTPIDYTITYNLNGGVNPSGAPAKYTYEAAVTLPRPTKTGYTFGGWFTSSNLTGTAVAQIAKNTTGNKTFYAKWTANRYTVKFDANGGSGSMGDLAMVYGTAKNLPSSNFTKTGYTFAGWSTQEDGGGTSYANGASVNNLTAVSGGSVTLHAKWTPVDYTITYKLDGGANPSGAPAKYTCEAAVTLPTPTKTGYTFAGWYNNSNLTGSAVTQIAKNTTGDKIYYAKWTVNEYWIGYDSNGGSTTIPGVKVTYDVSVNLSSTVPQRAGYTFAGWNTQKDGDGTSYASGQQVKNLAERGVFTLYAQWTTITYSIHFNGNGATDGMMADLPMTYGTAKNLTANAFSKEGCTFAGWATDPMGEVVYSDTQSVNNLLTAAGTVQLYAKWNTNSFNVTFNAHGGTATSAQKVAFGQKVPKPANPSKTGYAFLGWFKESSCTNEWDFDADTMPAGALELHAGWKANTFEVVFDVNNGTGIMTNEVFTYDESKKLTKNTMTRTGYTFTSWNTQPDGKGTAYADEATVSNLAESGLVTLYAQWKANHYRVDFIRNFPGMTTPYNPGLMVYYDQDAKLPPLPSGFPVTGYTFTGWNTQSDGKGTAYADQATVRNLTAVSKGEVTLYAQWRPNTYKIVFDGNGATEGQTGELDMAYGTEKKLPKCGFKKTGYAFAGWKVNPKYSTPDYKDEATVNNLTSTDGKTITLYAAWTLVMNYQVPTSTALSYDLATKTTVADGTQKITSTTVEPIKVSGIACEELDGAASVFPNEADRRKLSFSVSAGEGATVSLGVGASASGDALKDFVVPASSNLPLAFGLTVPSDVRVDYLGSGTAADVARFVYTIEPA